MGSPSSQSPKAIESRPDPGRFLHKSYHDHRSHCRRHLRNSKSRFLVYWGDVGVCIIAIPTKTRATPYPSVAILTPSRSTHRKLALHSCSSAQSRSATHSTLRHMPLTQNPGHIERLSNMNCLRQRNTSIGLWVTSLSTRATPLTPHHNPHVTLWIRRSASRYCSESSQRRFALGYTRPTYIHPMPHRLRENKYAPHRIQHHFDTRPCRTSLKTRYLFQLNSPRLEKRMRKEWRR